MGGKNAKFHRISLKKRFYLSYLNCEFHTESTILWFYELKIYLYRYLRFRFKTTHKQKNFNFHPRQNIVLEPMQNNFSLHFISKPLWYLRCDYFFLYKAGHFKYVLLPFIIWKIFTYSVTLIGINFTFSKNLSEENKRKISIENKSVDSRTGPHM